MSALRSALVTGAASGFGAEIARLYAHGYGVPKDLALAQQIHDRLYHTAEVFYSDPFVDMHNRMKEALVLLGRLPRAVVRPPLVKLSRAEIDRIRWEMRDLAN